MVSDPVAAWNEKIKMTAGFANAIGLGLVGFAVLRPLVEDIQSISLLTLWWWVAGLALHGVARYVLG